MSSNNSQLEKAKIKILNGKNAGQELEVKFNPSEYGLQKSIDYGEKEATASGMSVEQFINDTTAERLTMDLFFDTSVERKDVRTEYVNFIDKLVQIDGELHAPPMCKFIWGKGIEFNALVEDVNKQYTKFLPSGVPVRARVAVTFMEYGDSDFHLKDVSPESPDKTKTWRVKEGDTLWMIASQEYGDADHWREIAKANDVSNPRSIEAGDVLEIPPL